MSFVDVLLAAGREKNANVDGDNRLGGNNAEPGEFPLLKECVIKVDIDKVKAMTKANDVSGLATYLKSLITEGVSERTLAALKEKFGDDEAADGEDDPDDNDDIDADDKGNAKPDDKDD